LAIVNSAVINMGAQVPPPTNVYEDAGKKEPSYTAGGNVS
jgi:hypothetical protein